MNTIPLVKGNTQEEINTSLIALKKALDEMNSSSSKTDTSIQSQIKQINELITSINSHLDTIDGQITGLQPVDSVTSGNMQSVTSNAVASSIDTLNTALVNGLRGKLDLIVLQGIVSYTDFENALNADDPRLPDGMHAVFLQKGAWSVAVYLKTMSPNAYCGYLHWTYGGRLTARYNENGSGFFDMTLNS